MIIQGGFSCPDRFDPIAYAADIYAHPEKYITMHQISYEAEVLRQMRHCETLEALQSLFTEQSRKAKADRNKDFLDRLVAAKNTRKEQLA